LCEVQGGYGAWFRSDWKLRCPHFPNDGTLVYIKNLPQETRREIIGGCAGVAAGRMLIDNRSRDQKDVRGGLIDPRLHQPREEFNLMIPGAGFSDLATRF
jgi:hypothetical protein